MRSPDHTAASRRRRARLAAPLLLALSVQSVGCAPTDTGHGLGDAGSGVSTPAIASISHDTVVVHRASVLGARALEHARRWPAGWEQSWSFDGLPPGGFQVRVPVTAPHPPIIDELGAHFAVGATHAVSYGHGTWIDASGRRTHVPVEWEEGALVLRVPHELLSVSTFPAVLDPMITEEHLLDAPAGPRVGSDRLAQTGCTDESCMVAWRNSGTALRASMWAARFEPTGRLLDVAPIRLPHEDLCDVAVDGDQFVALTWDPFAISGGELLMTSLATRGPTDAVTTRVEGAGCGRLAAAEGVRAFLWADRSTGAAFVRRLDATGAWMEAPRPVGFEGFAADVLVTPSLYVLVGAGTYGDLFLRRMRIADGEWVDAAPVRVSEDLFSARQLVGSGCGASACVLATAESVLRADVGGPIVSARRVDGLRVFGAAMVEDARIAVLHRAWTGRGYEPRLRWMGADLSLTAESAVDWPAALVREAEVVLEGESPFAVLRAEPLPDGPTDDDLLYWPLRASGTPPVEPVPLAIGPAVQLAPDIVAAPGGALVTWTDYRDVHRSGGDIYAAALTSDGHAVSTVLLGSSEAHEQAPSIRVSGDVALVAWRHMNGVRARLLDARTAAPVGEPIDLGGRLFNPAVPRVGAHGGGFLVSWGGSDAEVVSVSRSGSVDWRRSFTGGRGCAGDCAGDRCFVACMEDIFTVAGTLLSASDGTVIAGPSALWRPSTEQYLSDVVVSGDRVLVASSHVRSAFGVVSLATGRPIAAHVELPDAWTRLPRASARPGGGWTVVREDNRRTIEVRRIRPDGAWVEEPPLELLDQALEGSANRHRVAIADVGGGRALAAYVRDFDLDSRRIAIRSIEWAPRGAACESDSECGSTFCVDGVCCESSCGGAVDDCQACSVLAGAETDGLCQPLERGVVCRAATGECDLAERCDGTSPSCPVDVQAADGTTCGEPSACGPQLRCVAGACELGPSETCDDGDACTVDTCVVPTGCHSERIHGCCLAAGDCDDGDACTNDLCRESACVHDPLESCCRSDDECDDGSPGTRDRCVDGACTHADLCEHEGTCCAEPSDCDDGDPGTDDLCTDGSCEHTPGSTPIEGGCGCRTSAPGRGATWAILVFITGLLGFTRERRARRAGRRA